MSRPYRPRPCPEPGCPDLDCERHTVRDRSGETPRPTSAARGYDAAWRRLRLWYLHRHPLCERCSSPGTVELPNELDHRVALVDGGARLDPKNLQTLCHPCHNRKTAEDARARRAARTD